MKSSIALPENTGSLEQDGKNSSLRVLSKRMETLVETNEEQDSGSKMHVNG